MLREMVVISAGMAAALLVACNGNEPVIMGTVVAGPQCAVVREGETCPDEPTAADIVVRRSLGLGERPGQAQGGEVVATGRAGSDGRFEISLPPGDYVLETEAENVMWCDAVQVTVPSEGSVETTIMCDTGIR